MKRVLKNPDLKSQFRGLPAPATPLMPPTNPFDWLYSSGDFVTLWGT